MSVIREFVAAGVWPLLLFLVVIAVVTAIALVRAEKQDIPAVFESFAEAFGFHKPPEPPEGQRDTEQMTLSTETEEPDEEAR